MSTGASQDQQIFPRLVLSTTWDQTGSHTLRVPLEDQESPKAAIMAVWMMVNSYEPFWVEARGGRGFFIQPNRDQVVAITCEPFDED